MVSEFNSIIKVETIVKTVRIEILLELLKHLMKNGKWKLKREKCVA